VSALRSFFGFVIISTIMLSANWCAAETSNKWSHQDCAKICPMWYVKNIDILDVAVSINLATYHFANPDTSGMMEARDEFVHRGVSA
jgi:hypothetical protein